MNKIGSLLIVVVSMGSFGCTMNRTKGDVDPELDCRDRRMTVNHGPAFLIAYPEYIQVCEGQTITIHVEPRVGKGEARTMQAKGNPAAARWLDRQTEDDSGEIRIVVPEGTLADTERDAVYKYSIRIAGVGTLDPRVRVVRR